MNAVQERAQAHGLNLNVNFNRADLIDAGWEFEYSGDPTIVLALIHQGTGTCLAGMRLIEIGSSLVMRDPPGDAFELNDLCKFLHAHETKFTLTAK